MIWIDGKAGRLEGLLGLPEEDVHSHAVLLCHPHPLYGGTMHNRVVYAAARGALDLGMPVLRFNFRGAGASDGKFDGRAGEIADVQAALDHLAADYPGRALIAGGVSFGAWVAALAAAADPRVPALVSIATAISIHGEDYLSEISKPMVFVQASDDEFGPASKLADVIDRRRVNGRLVRIEGTTHLFPGHSDEVRAAVRELLAAVIGTDLRRAGRASAAGGDATGMNG
jgi:alpha/beta superfamily hydrolase